MKCILRISTSSTGSISISHIAKVLAPNHVACSIRSNLSVVVNTDESWIEEGFEIEIFNLETKDEIRTLVWEPLRNAFNIHCAHIHIRGRGFSGCIHNYLDVEDMCKGKKQCDTHMIYSKHT